MNRCNRCNINIIDDSVKCPLCHGVLTHDENEVSAELTYPMVSQKRKALYLLFKITIFASVIIEAICVLINYLTSWQVKWSLVTGVALVYVCFTMLYSVRRNKSHQRKMIMQLVAGLVMVLAIDIALGYNGWSVTYIIPGAIMLMDVGLGVLMIVNKNSWQNYIMAQIWMVVVSIACLILGWFEIDGLPLLALIAMGISVVALAISIVFGDRRAKSELYRRFHI